MSDLTAKQQQAVTLLASGKSQRQTAKAVGVSPQTITAWMKLDAFQKGLDGLLSTVEAESTQLLRSQRLKAVGALTDLLDSKTPAVKLAAAKTVLELTSKSAPATALDTRFTAIMTLLQGAPTP
ncbi:MAG: helix-turn-helix domain-containing protein [Comamonadaceae bacterium]|nr:helix-turn-helix domain-containing protein [Comamonadaceae bacterium]